mmetsp:Transcript_10798/g.23145  ORF Transcript_10798/g.23145 Transcript_10798/m.23145 type:complete len:81 (-) Transcript_10798:1634-1876(-)
MKAVLFTCKECSICLLQVLSNQQHQYVNEGTRYLVQIHCRQTLIQLSTPQSTLGNSQFQSSMPSSTYFKTFLMNLSTTRV